MILSEDVPGHRALTAGDVMSPLHQLPDYGPALSSPTLQK